MNSFSRHGEKSNLWFKNLSSAKTIDWLRRHVIRDKKYSRVSLTTSIAFLLLYNESISLIYRKSFKIDRIKMNTPSKKVENNQLATLKHLLFDQNWKSALFDYE